MSIPSVSVWKAGNGIFIEYCWEYLWETLVVTSIFVLLKHIFFQFLLLGVFLSVPESLCYAPYVSDFVSHRISSVCLSSYHFFFHCFFNNLKT